MIYQMKFIFAVLSVFVVGWTLLGIIDRRRVYASFLERFALSCGLGLGMVALAQLFLVFLRVPITTGVILTMIIPFWVYLFFKYSPDIFDFEKIAASFTRTRTRVFAFSPFEVVLAGLIAALCLMMAGACLLMPKYTWDSRAAWGLLAKVIYQYGTIFTPDFLDVTRYLPGVRYPLFIPFAENFFYRILGNVDEYLVKVIYGLMYLSWTGLIYTVQRKYFSLPRPAALAGTFIAASVPCLFVIYSGSVPSAYADFPLGCFYTFAAVYLFQYIRLRRREDIIIAASFICICLFTKNEGRPLFLLVCVVLLFEAFKSGYFKEKGGRSALVIFMIMPLAVLIPWFIIHRSIQFHGEDQSVMSDLTAHFLERLPVAWRIQMLSLREMFLNLKSWGMSWYIIILAIFLFPAKKMIDGVDRRVLSYMLILPLAYYLFVLTPVYMVMWIGTDTPIDIEFQGTSFERFRIHVLPLLLLYSSIAIGTFMGARNNGKRLNE